MGDSTESTELLLALVEGRGDATPEDLYEACARCEIGGSPGARAACALARHFSGQIPLRPDQVTAALALVGLSGSDEP